MFTSPKEGGGRTAATVPPPNPTPNGPLPLHLREHVHRLRLILSVISVSVLALRNQSAELDDDIATVLDQHASEPLDFEIEDLEALLKSLTAQRVKELVA
jgi:hypothetical protein